MKSFIIISFFSLCCIHPNLASLKESTGTKKRELSQLYFPERMCRVTRSCMQKTIYLPEEVERYNMLQVLLKGDDYKVFMLHIGNLTCSNSLAPTELSPDTFDNFVETWQHPLGKVECFKDALQIWYQTKEPNVTYDSITPEVELWKSLLIYGILEFKEEPYVIPLLDTRGTVVAPVLPNKCMAIGSAETVSTYCLRTSPRLTGCPSGRECVSIDEGPMGCQCLQGYQEDTSGQCQDINECAPNGEGAIFCKSKNQDCVNKAGRYICLDMPKTTSQLPASLPATTTPCLDTELDLGNKTHQYCVDKKVLIPPEIRCSINIHLYNGQTVKARLTAITPVIDPIKSFTNLSNKVVTLTWTTATLDANNNDTFTNWTIKERTLLCEDFAATFIPTSVMLVHSLDRPYLIKDHILNARDISYHMRKLLIHDGKYKSSASAAACYADAIVFLTVGNTRLRQINVTSTEKGLIIPDTTRMTIDFDPTHPLPLEIDTCKSYTVSDKCFDKSDLQDDHCKAKNSVCITKGHDTFGCTCRRGYSPTHGECVDNTMCSPGLKLVNNLCVDIDECEGHRNPCGTEQICVNYYGGYSCIDPNHCGQGMTHDTSINRCVDVDECTMGTSGCDNSTTTCKNLRGGVQCVCKTKGYVHTASAKSCEPPRFEYRLLDPDRIKCCSHRGHQGSAVLTRFTMNGQGDYLDVIPMFCIHGSPVRVQVPNTYATPILVDSSSPNSLQTESLLDYVKIMQIKGVFKDNDVLVDIQYTNGCETKFKLVNRNPTNVHRQSLQWYLLKTPVSHTYYDTTKTGFGSMNCDMPFPTNINWYKEKLTQRPTARQRQKCMTRAKSLAITITSTISVLSFSFIIKML